MGLGSGGRPAVRAVVNHQSQKVVSRESPWKPKRRRVGAERTGRARAAVQTRKRR
jgi:hypothetical protein